MRTLLIPLIAALGLTAAALAAPARAQEISGQAAGQAVGQPTEVKLSAAPRTDARGNKVKGFWFLGADVSTKDGKPVGDRSVDFYEAVQFFGARDKYLGSATTDSTGHAVLLFQPTTIGKVAVAATLPSGGGFATSSGKLELTVAETVPVYEPPALPFALFRVWLPIGLGLLVVATWAVLIGTLVLTIARLKAAPGARAARPPSGPERKLESIGGA